MRKLALQPAQASYKVVPGNEVIANKLAGGRGRYRRDLIGATATVSARWPLQVAGELQYFWAFYYTVIDHGSLPFLADLVIDRQALTTHVCNIIPETIGVINTGGPNYEVFADLEVEPAVRDDDFDLGFVLAYEAWEDRAEINILSLEHIVNVVMPGSLPG